MKQFILLFIMFFLFICPVNTALSMDLELRVPIPENSREFLILKETAEKTAAKSNGHLNLVFLPPGKNGSGVADDLRKNHCHGGLILPQEGGALNLDPAIYTYAKPLTFRSSSQVETVRHQLDSTILTAVSKGAYQGLGIVDFGFIYLMSSNDLSTKEEWLKRTIWIPESTLIRTGFEILGLKTVSAGPGEVLTLFNNQEADTLIAPLSGAILKRWHTRIKQVFNLPFSYTYGIWILKTDVFSALKEDHRRILEQQMAVLSANLGRAFQKRDDKARNVFTRYRINFVDPEPDMAQTWSEWSALISRELVNNKQVRSGLVESIQALLSDPWIKTE